MRKLFLSLLIACVFGAVAQAQTPTNSAPLAITPDMLQLGHGVNLGNMLEAPREGDWGQKLQSDYFPTIRHAGFTLIRLPIRWAAHISTAPHFIIDPAFFNRVDWAVAQAKQYDLKIILDYHNDDALMKDPDANADRFVAIWKQISDHYRDQPATILFELLNEPNNKLDGPRWNTLLARTLTIIRKSNPNRTVVVGPVLWNHIEALPQLMLPEGDQNLLVTVHFYDGSAINGWEQTLKSYSLPMPLIAPPPGAWRTSVRFSSANLAPSVKATSSHAYAGHRSSPGPPSLRASLGLTGSFVPPLASMIPRRAPGESHCTTL
jgi:endoglucanase